MTKVLHIAYSDGKWGRDAGARRVHEELLKRGVESELWVFDKSSEEEGVHQFTAGRQRTGHVLCGPEAEEMLHGRSIGTFDVVHIYGMGSNVQIAQLPRLQAKRLLWTLYDCAPYTAGCSHSAHCQQWTEKPGCMHCPLYSDAEQQAGHAKILELKKKMARELQVEFICQNEWQKEQLSRSIWKKHKAEVCPDVLDTERFHLGNQRHSRQALGIPENAFVAVLPTDWQEGRGKALGYVQNVLQQIRHQYQGYFVLVNLSREALRGEWPVDELRNVNTQEMPALIGDYYRAADVQLYLAGTDSRYAEVREAGRCALPSVVFAIGAASSLAEVKLAKAIPSFSESDLGGFLLESIRAPQTLQGMGMTCYLQLQKETMRSSLELYLPRQEKAEAVQADYTEVLRSGGLIARSYLHSRVQEWAEEKDDTEEQKKTKQVERNVFIDHFCKAWLDTLSPADSESVWELAGAWRVYRQIAAMPHFRADTEVNAHLEFCQALRIFLTKYFQTVSFADFSRASAAHVTDVVSLWFFLFLNVAAVLNRGAKSFACPPELLQVKDLKGYPKYMIWSMYTPYAPKPLDLDVAEIISSPERPLTLRLVMVFWLLTAPFFGGTEGQRQSVLQQIEKMCRYLEKNPNNLSSGLLLVMMDRIMISLWQISYLGGNNIKALRAYGDFLQRVVQVKYPAYSTPVLPRKRSAQDKLRIGYVSTNFRNQAVSQYMANRIKYHDKDKYHVKTFLMSMSGRNFDGMSQKIRDWSDEYEDYMLGDLERIDEIAERIKKSRLDMVIYADIGMNSATYILGAMHLAPVQAVLVGHGTTTGLTSLDYYVSGDHEPANAQEHYTEQIVRLPNAGVAQLPPIQSNRKLSRKDFDIPEDAVLFMSCANGLKHVVGRDHLLIEILQKAPNAYILLKPYVMADAIDWKFRARLMKLAEPAGVADRLKIIPPLADSGDLMALLMLADVQLDTYPYGGWTTNLEALYYHLPIVTQQGDMARSRWGAGLLQAMDITEGIAHSDQEYVDWAVRFAQDALLRKTLSDKITQRAPQVLFNGEAAQPSYEAALQQMAMKKEEALRKAHKG